MTRHFLTYFDTLYAARGLAMIESMFVHCPGAELTVLCLDEQVRGILADRWGERITTVSCKDLAQSQPRLAAMRSERAPWEFYATHKAVLVGYALARAPANALISFIDADTYFYSSPETLFEAMQGYSIGVSSHRFLRPNDPLLRYGKFNAGFGIWRNDLVGRLCIESWTEECLNWCFNRVEGERFMNQGYLSAWPDRFPGVTVLEHPGHNLAYWNVRSHRLQQVGDAVTVDSQPLIFFHFSNVSCNARGCWQTAISSALLQSPMLNGVWRPYLAALDRIASELTRDYDVTGLGSVRTEDALLLTIPIRRAAA